MRTYNYCMNCRYYNRLNNISGYCEFLSGIVKENIVILDRATIIEKIALKEDAANMPMIVPNLFGCVYQKEK